MEKVNDNVKELTISEKKRISGGLPWLVAGLAVWAISEVINGVIDGLEEPC